ncbi:MAG: regulatory protein RecX [Pseudomonadota bacterium]
MSKNSEEALRKLRAAIADVAKHSPRAGAETPGARPARGSDGVGDNDAGRETRPEGGRAGSPGIRDDDAPPACDDGPDARELALRLLTRREHGAGELARKLQQRGVSRDEAREAIAEMAEQGWQSDERFAAQFAADHAARGDGPLKIRAALQARGVNDGVLTQALDALGADWLALACKVRCKRFGADLPGTAEDRARQIRFLMTRGFSTSVARTAVRSTDFQED